MNAAALNRFKTAAVTSRAALWPGSIIISGQTYAGAVRARKVSRETEDTGWIQVRLISGQFLITVLPLAIVIDTTQPSQPIRPGIILTHDSITYRLTSAQPDESGLYLFLHGEEEHPSSK